ncbi:MAG TPA: conjugal transfer protein TraR, partial [Alphaproteobacteria bacterium]|nr:conjugal transfer protein TraR [Alphaproteobacteria bacterium]
MDKAACRRNILQEIDELRALSDGSREGRAPVELDQQSVGRLSRMDAMQQQSMDV